MTIKYKIVSVDTEHYSILVRYYCEELPDQHIEYNINIQQTPSPNKEELGNIISKMAPRKTFELKLARNNPNIDTNLEVAKSLIGQELLVNDIAYTPSNTRVVPLTDREIEELIEKMHASDSIRTD